jgi:hypothetical protein
MSWERAGAASGLLAVILFLVAFIIHLGQDPTGTPAIPDVANAQDFGAYLDDHEESLKVQVLLNSVAIVLFLWFLGSLWAHLRAAEGGPARLSAIASAGGIAGAIAVLMGLVFLASALVNPEAVGAGGAYVVGAMSIGLGGAAFTVFFLAAGTVIMKTRALPFAVGALAWLTAAASALGFVSIFADQGVFNAATGAFGYWVRVGAFIVWLGIASLVLIPAKIQARYAERSAGGRRSRRR